jgi:SAM-dependent methyltransferase
MTLIKDIKIYFRMLFSYKPKTFWNELLSNSFDLRGVGHFRMSNEENLKMYEEKKKIIIAEMQKNHININGSTAVLEIGCGVGYWTEMFEEMGVKNYTGNDIAEISIKNLSTKFPEYEFIKGDISETPLRESIYDLGFMIDVTQHITDDERFVKGLSNIWKSLKAGAYFIVTIWDPGKNVYLANKLRINKIEKPRGLDWYKKIYDNEGELISKADFNDKYLLIIKKLSK